MPRPRQLQRTRSASDIPPLDRAITQGLCRLIVALDRMSVEAPFFSRTIVACKGTLVWPETVVRAMGVTTTEAAPEAPTVTAAHPGNRRSPWVRTLLSESTAEADPVYANALVDPDRLLQLRSTHFERFAQDGPHRLMVAQATLKWLATAPDPTPLVPVLRNSESLARWFGLSEGSTQLLQWMALVMHSEPTQKAIGMVKCWSMREAVEIMTRWLGHGRQTSVEALFGFHGVLVPLRLHEGMDTSTVDLQGALKLNSSVLVEQLGNNYASEARLMDTLIPKAPMPGITLDDIAHLLPQHGLNKALLHQAGQQRTPGVHLFLYGPSGTGKTEYARLLAQDAGLTLYDITATAPQHGHAKPRQRLSPLVWTLRALAGQPNVAVLMDDAEDFLACLHSDHTEGPLRYGRAWVHHFLETNPIPILWTAQSIDRIDPGTLRRFTRVQALSPATIQTRWAATQKHLAPLGLDKAALQSVAATPGLTPAHIAATAALVTLAAPTCSTQAQAWVQQQIESVHKLPRTASPTADAAAGLHFDPVYLNVRNGPPLNRLLDRLKSHPAVSLCFHGVPGTGKTDFAHYLARQLGRELIVKTASDLLSKWSGETESRIAAMFAECAQSPYEKMLLLDEADTFLRHRHKVDKAFETAGTNEFLARMVHFPGTFICTTNLFEEIDGAVLRRFQFRMQFEALRPPQCTDLFATAFGMAAPPQTGLVTGLVPADFSNVKRQLDWLDHAPDANELLRMLRVESTARQGQLRLPSSMGFLDQ